MGSVRELFATLKNFREGEGDRFCRGVNPAFKDLPSVRLCPKIRLFIVGHSFGGLMVYNALSESLITSITNTASTVVGE